MGDQSFGFAYHADYEVSFRIPEHAMTLSADGSILLSDTYGREDDVFLWDISSGRRLGSFARSGPGTSDWSGVAVRNDNLVAATGSTDFRFRGRDFGFDHLLTFWDVDSRERIGTIPIPGFGLEDLFFAPSDRLFSVSQGTVIEWDIGVQT